jgi:hypothetical protein
MVLKHGALAEEIARLEEEVERLEKVRKALDRGVQKKRTITMFVNKISKMMLELEKNEADILETSREVAASDDANLYITEAVRWTSLLERYQGHIWDAFGGKRVIDTGAIIDISTRRG